MKSPKIEEMSNEALLQRKKTTQFVTGLLAGMLMAGVALASYLWVQQGARVALPLLITFVALSPIVWLTLTDLRSVKRELQARNVTL